MKFRLAVLFLLLTVAAGQAQSTKRGMAYGHHTPEDMEVLSPEVSWWYNWSETPESAVADVFGDYGFDFVPMTWNGYFNETELRAFLTDHPETKYLLAFNEPNFIEQANMKPSEAAAIWPQLEAIADDFNLLLVSPAVNFCGNCVEEGGVTYTDPFDYLDDFFAACPDCRVDHIAVHCYMNTVSALQWYMGEFERYGKPIWLTEFAGWESNGNVNNLNDQINYMIGAVDYLETNPNIFRYAWFIGRGPGIANYPYIDLLGANGELTALGQVYKQMPVHDTTLVVDIPARIEAEAYNRMSGFLIERTSDPSGFANVGYTDPGDWLEYKIQVPADNTYDIRFRLASTKSGSLNVLIDDAIAVDQSFTSTGGWQNWQNFDNTIELTSGEHTLRLYAVTDGFNINWIQIGINLVNLEERSAGEEPMLISPNPANDRVMLQTSKPYTDIQIFSLQGVKLLTMPFREEISLGDLPPGVYFLRASDSVSKHAETKRILLH